MKVTEVIASLRDQQHDLAKAILWYRATTAAVVTTKGTVVANVETAQADISAILAVKRSTQIGSPNERAQLRLLSPRITLVANAAALVAPVDFRPPRFRNEQADQDLGNRKTLPAEQLAALNEVRAGYRKGGWPGARDGFNLGACGLFQPKLHRLRASAINSRHRRGWHLPTPTKAPSADSLGNQQPTPATGTSPTPTKAPSFDNLGNHQATLAAQNPGAGASPSLQPQSTPAMPGLSGSMPATNSGSAGAPLGSASGPSPGSLGSTSSPVTGSSLTGRQSLVPRQRQLRQARKPHLRLTNGAQSPQALPAPS